MPLQEEVIDNVLAGRDSLALMPTGSGKSLCYQLPALCMDGVTLVVSPLIAMMKDQVDALKRRGIAADFINSSMTYEDARRVRKEAYGGRLDILYAAPERVSLQRFRDDFLRYINLSLIAIDEAHCISEWGHDFRPDYRKLQSLRDALPKVPVIALTATATERVRQDILDQLRMPNAEPFVASFNRPNLTYRVMPKRRSFDTLVELLRRIGDGSAIVYRFSRQNTETLAADLSARGLRALPYHAGLEDEVRRETQERFISGDAPIIVATIAFGMGVDKPNVRLVVHYDLPKTIEGYYQETGRAGRDGLPSECALFYSYADKINQEYFIRRLKDAERENAEEKLAKMVEYGEARTCRRAFLLGYFGEAWPDENCGACDVCLADSEEPDAASAYDGTDIAQKALSAVIRMGERFGANHVAAVLRGSRSKRVLQFGHDELRVYGSVKGMPDDDVKDALDQLIDKGLAARRTDGDYPTLYVTERGREFLKGRETMTLTRRAPPRADAAGEPDAELFDKLRAVRKKIAGEMDVPAFVVFGDAALRQMAIHAPRDSDSLLRVKGVGESKLQQFGDRFIAAIRGHAQERGGARTGNPHAPAGRQEVGQTHTRTLEMVREGLNVAEIAARRGIAQQTALTHLERLAESGEPFDVTHILPPPHKYARIEYALRVEDSDRLAPVKDRLGGGYSFEEIRLVRLHIRQNSSGGDAR